MPLLLVSFIKTQCSRDEKEIRDNLVQLSNLFLQHCNYVCLIFTIILSVCLLKYQRQMVAKLDKNGAPVILIFILIIYRLSVCSSLKVTKFFPLVTFSILDRLKYHGELLLNNINLYFQCLPYTKTSLFESYCQLITACFLKRHLKLQMKKNWGHVCSKFLSHKLIELLKIYNVLLSLSD